VWYVIISKIPGWDGIRHFTRNPAFKFSALWLFLIPLLARLLAALKESSKNAPEPNPWISWWPENLPVTWNLLYICSALALLGLICFKIRCPNPVREFENWNDFKTKNFGPTELKQHLQELARTRAVSIGSMLSNLQVMTRDGEILLPHDRQDLKLEADWHSMETWLSIASINPGKVGEAYSSIERLAADSRTPSRLINTLLYLGAFGIVGYFLVRNAWFVLSP
jgi:hypothetical protein